MSLLYALKNLVKCKRGRRVYLCCRDAQSLYEVRFFSIRKRDEMGGWGQDRSSNEKGQY